MLNLILIGNFRAWIEAVDRNAKRLGGDKIAAFRSLMQDLKRHKDVMDSQAVCRILSSDGIVHRK